MTSKIDICNLALVYLKQSPLASLDEQNVNARAINLFYEPVRMEILRLHDWAFARRTARLVEMDVAQEEKPGPGRAFAYPADALWVGRIVLPGYGYLERSKFRTCFSAKQNRRFLLVNAPEGLRVEYTADITDTTLFDPAFAKLFALSLAVDLAGTLCGNETVKKGLYQELSVKREEARFADKEEGFEVPQQSSVFEEAR